MKTAIITMVLVALAVGQVELKGITIGGKLSASKMATASTAIEGITAFKTSVGGVDGELAAFSLKDGRVYGMSFNSKDRVYKSDVMNVKNGFEKKYGIEFDLTVEEHTDNATFRAETPTQLFLIVAEYNQFLKPPYKLTVYIKNDKLSAVATLEDQEKSSEDF